MSKTDFHMHTVFCDGQNTPEEMVRSAIEKGMRAVGISGHSYTWFDESYCMKKEMLPAYRAELSRLKKAYADRIRVLCGIEQDFYSEEPAAGYDYVIGSVHYFRLGDEFIPVDDGNEHHRRAAEQYFGGDLYALAEEYYRTVGLIAEKTGCDIIGHFDVLTKYYDADPELDVTHPRYRAAWQAAADRLIRAGVPFEINTGAMSRGVKKTPYPSEEILSYLGQRGASVVFSSDAHTAGAIMFAFDRLRTLAEACGLRVVEL